MNEINGAAKQTERTVQMQINVCYGTLGVYTHGGDHKAWKKRVYKTWKPIMKWLDLIERVYGHRAVVSVHVIG